MISQADVIAYVLADLVLILVAARMLGRAASALRQPRVAGEIAAGILIGPTLLGGHVGTGSTEGAGLVDRLYPAEAFAFLSLIGQIGLVLYMFLVGIALDRRALRRRKRQIGVVATATGVAPIALGFAAAPLFDSSAWRPLGVGDLTFSLFLAAGLAATALPVLARLLQEKGLVATPVGVITVGVAGLVTVIAFLLVAAGSASATGGGVVVDVVLRLGLAVSFTLLLLLIVRPVLGWVLGSIDAERNIGSILSLLVILALASGLVADRIGVTALIGGLFLGLVVPLTPGLVERVEARLHDVVVLVFLPVFFAVSGLVTDLRVLDFGMAPGLLLFFVLLVAAKWLPAYLAGRATGLAGAEAHAVGVLVTCGGVLALVVGLTGLELGVLTSELQVTFVLGALVTLVLAGPLVDRLLAAPAVPAEAMREPGSVAPQD